MFKANIYVVTVLGRIAGERMIIKDNGSGFVDIAVQDAAKTWGEAIECHMN